MGRHFDGDFTGFGGQAYIRLGVNGFTAMAYGSVFAVVYIQGIDTVKAPTLVVVGGDSGDFIELYISNTAPNPLKIWNGTASASSTVNAPLNEWCLIGFTKGAGTVTPRLHLYRWPTNAWTHQNATGTLADAAGTGATEHTIGGLGSSADDLAGDMAAAMVIKSRALSDSEVERLPRGQWSMFNPDLLVEFPSGRDNPANTRDLSRFAVRETASAGQSRASRTDPPGFRFSPRRR